MFDYVFKRKKTWATVFFLDLIGSLLFFFRSREVPKEVRRILVIRLDHIGDLVMSAPFFSALRACYPAAEIHLLADSRSAALFEHDPRLDHVIPLDGHWFSRNGRVQWFQMFRCAMGLRRVGYDLGFDLRGDFRTIFFFLFLAGVKYKASYGVRGGGFMLSASPLYPYRTHEVDRNVNLLAFFMNREIKAELPKIESDPDIRKMMETRLETQGRDKSRKLILCHLGAGYPSKQWRIDRYLKVIESLLDRGGIQIALIGKENEVDLPAEFLDRHDVLNFIGKTSLKELVALTGLADYFLGNDSGPAHIAGACGVPLLVVFSGTNRVEEWAPRARISRIIHRDLECSPCEAKICPLKHHNCMELIPEDEVLEGFLKLERQAHENRV